MPRILYRWRWPGSFSCPHLSGSSAPAPKFNIADTANTSIGGGEYSNKGLEIFNSVEYADVLDNGQIEKSIRFNHYLLSLANGLKPVASVNVEINGKSYERSSVGDGQYDAFMKALWKIYDELGKPHPVLEDYAVTIPPGGKTDALVETVITWKFNDKKIKTRGLHPDQTEAAIKATERMLNIIEHQKTVSSIQ